MTDQLLIREYLISDKRLLVEILKLSVPDFFGESEVADFEEYIDHEVESYFVIESDEVIIGGGGLNFFDNKSTARISWDFINPAFHGKGIGQKLLKYRIDILKSMTIDSIFVRTSQLAYGFYEKNGFVLQSITKDYWAPGYDLYDMKYVG
ncbi:MAG: GNAT family N-acetyltransferase [Bacteroidota bacterium]|nr:GNAT family N-acetyltransferase [Bacteroidota bacterium]